MDNIIKKAVREEPKKSQDSTTGENVQIGRENEETIGRVCVFLNF